mmetsp:Transcript_16604/g.35876  ORF Transcript_16604/g.35876 Transcript_16604/m.35876 type:complete len:83 (+) Transcript_16604:2984-3232(+)
MVVTHAVAEARMEGTNAAERRANFCLSVADDEEAPKRRCAIRDDGAEKARQLAHESIMETAAVEETIRIGYMLYSWLDIIVI